MTSFLVAVLMTMPMECPNYCVEWAKGAVQECYSTAKATCTHDKAQKCMDDCLDKIKDDYLYKRCKPLCSLK